MDDASRKVTLEPEVDQARPKSHVRPAPADWKDGTLRVGVHVSIAGGVRQSLERAYALGCTALQIFSTSPRMWPARRGVYKWLTAAEAERFRVRRAELALGPLVVHDNYLINLASPDRATRTRSIQALREELARALWIGADYLVLHPGNAGNAPLESAIAAIVEGLRRATRGLSLGELHILLENTAGQGSALGWRFEHLEAILRACPELPLGVCLDTAHTFAAGYDLSSETGLQRTLSEFAATIGFERLHVVHVNDSKAPAGSRVDRHEHIGRGKIGLENFRRFLNHPWIRDWPGRAFILETPVDRPGDDRRNLRTVWALFGQALPVRAGARDGFPARRISSAKRRTQKRAALRNT